MLHRIDAGRDHGTKHAESIEALGARPLLERLVLAQEINAVTSFTAGIAEYIIAGSASPMLKHFLPMTTPSRLHR